MGEAYLDLLKAFSFKEMQIWIATISALLFSCNLLGGILSALMFVNSNTLRPRPLTERISFRLFIMSEVLLLIFIFFYHVFMIERMSVSHIIYWISAVMMMPLLAVIGSQAIFVSFSGRMKAKDDAWKQQQRAIRAQRAQAVEAAGGAPAKSSAKAGAKAGAKPGTKPGARAGARPGARGGNPAARALSGRKGKPA